MIALAFFLGFLLPAIDTAAWIYSSSRFSTAQPFALGAYRLLSIGRNSTIESAANTNKYEAKAIEYEIEDVQLTSAVEIDTKFIRNDLFIPTRPSQQYKPSNASSHLASSEFEIDI